MKQAPGNDGHTPNDSSALKPLAVRFLEDTLEKGGIISIPCLKLTVKKECGAIMVTKEKSK